MADTNTVHCLNNQPRYMN